MGNDTVTVGNVEITSLTDGYLEFKVSNFFPTIPAESWAAHQEHLTRDNWVHLNLGSYLVRSDGRTILVDTGMGPKPVETPSSTWGLLLQGLKAKGVQPDDIDMVVMTHLHRDHVGWNLVSLEGKYEPTFPNARYWMSAKDWEACKLPANKERFANAPSCVWPLEELGLAELVDGERALTSELTTLPTPGHTPGHMSIMIASQGERALILGDSIHSPAQAHETDWVSRADMDPEQTRVTRRSIMERLEREGILGAVGHFPAPGFGRMVRLEGRRVWQAL